MNSNTTVTFQELNSFSDVNVMVNTILRLREQLIEIVPDIEEHDPMFFITHPDLIPFLDGTKLIPIAGLFLVLLEAARNIQIQKRLNETLS